MLTLPEISTPVANILHFYTGERNKRSVTKTPPKKYYKWPFFLLPYQDWPWWRPSWNVSPLLEQQLKPRRHRMDSRQPAEKGPAFKEFRLSSLHTGPPPPQYNDTPLGLLRHHLCKMKRNKKRFNRVQGERPLIQSKIPNASDQNLDSEKWNYSPVIR